MENEKASCDASGSIREALATYAPLSPGQLLPLSWDDGAVRTITDYCRKHAADATDEEIVHFIHEKGKIAKRNRVSDPISHLVKTVPECFGGEELSRYRAIQREKAQQDERGKLRIPDGRKRLSIVIVVVMLLTIVLWVWWSEERSFEEGTGRCPPCAISSSMLGGVIEGCILICAWLICLNLIKQKPRVAFGVSLATGLACVLWAFYGFYLILEVFAVSTKQRVEPGFIAGFLTVVFPSAIAHLLIGMFVVSFSLPAFFASPSHEKTESLVSG